MRYRSDNTICITQRAPRNVSGALAAFLLLASCTADRPAARHPQGSVAALSSASLPTTPDTLSLAERQAIPGRITFISERDGNKQVYSIRPSGADERRLSHSVTQEFNAAPLPGSDAITVISLRGEGDARVEQFGVQQTTGGERRPVGVPGPSLRHPSWTPDGRWLLYEAATPGEYREIYRVARDGTHPQRLTHNPEGNFSPVVSPDGAWVVFISSRDSAAELYRMHPDGTEQERITHTPRDEWSPRWSSDGGLLAFLSDRDGSDRAYLSYPDGREVRRLSSEDADPFTADDKPTWSPVGFRIAWVVRPRDAPSRILLADVSSAFRGEVRARGQGQLDDPTWSPDGKYLAFTVTRGDSVQVYLSRADGTAPTRITRATGPNWNPAWVRD